MGRGIFIGIPFALCAKEKRFITLFFTWKNNSKTFAVPNGVIGIIQKPASGTN
jgi:hypothetical protein